MREEFECPVCFNIMVEPSRMECNHFVCIQCLRGIIVQNCKCPMCRRDLPKNEGRMLKIDLEKQ